MLRIVAGCCCALWLTGCAPTPSFPESADSLGDAPPMMALDKTRTGTVEGRVVWSGERPVVAAFEFPLFQIGGLSWQRQPNPLAPRISAEGGIDQAIIWLQGGHVRINKAWPHGDVRVEMRDLQCRICQDGRSDLTTGIVRRGDDVEYVAVDAMPHSIRSRGANFFTLQFPEANAPLKRPCLEPGLAELLSATNYFWARGYLFVADHPYITRTDAEGRFRLTDVPDGDYEVVCWLPNYRIAKQERDPETSATARQWYAAPVEKTQRVTVRAGQMHQVPFTISEAHFLTSRAAD